MLHAHIILIDILLRKGETCIQVAEHLKELRMNKTNVYILFGVVLIVGLALGYSGAMLFEPAGASKVRNPRLQVGDVAPDFRLPDHTGGYVKLSDYREKRYVVIAFYPLAWTPV